jgi:hypothetical protein
LAAFSASENGVLVYWTGALETRELVWLDRAGKRLGVIGKPDRIIVESPRWTGKELSSAALPFPMPLGAPWTSGHTT